MLVDNKFNINFRLWTQQVLAVFYKKTIYLRRHWIRLLGSLIMIVLALYFGLNTSNDPNTKNTTVPTQSQTTHRFDPETLSGGRILLQLTNPTAAVGRFDTALSDVLRGRGVEIVKFSAEENLEKCKYRQIYAFHLVIHNKHFI